MSNTNDTMMSNIKGTEMDININGTQIGLNINDTEIDVEINNDKINDEFNHNKNDPIFFTNINVQSADPNTQFNTKITPFNIETTDVLTECVNTKIVTSDTNLLLTCGYGHTINVPNITYRCVLNTNGIITPIDMTMGKIFVCSVNTLLMTDETTDGIEIIIFNRSSVSNIIIRSNLSIICNLCPKTACRLIYIFIENVWIIV